MKFCQRVGDGKATRELCCPDVRFSLLSCHSRTSFRTHLASDDDDDYDDDASDDYDEDGEDGFVTPGFLSAALLGHARATVHPAILCRACEAGTTTIDGFSCPSVADGVVPFHHRCNVSVIPYRHECTQGIG